ncbi:hypothetical protein [Longimicrobium sp.]|jgi:hypothetical protein|uniref:hypothetical protein n=1 Tax=Longimicrobium sp. TaxID=2029185 RepID=UPI002EDA794E
MYARQVYDVLEIPAHQDVGVVHRGRGNMLSIRHHPWTDDLRLNIGIRQIQCFTSYEYFLACVRGNLVKGFAALQEELAPVPCE